ncbi:Cytochrome c oxidase assembly protein cox18, mitochondrial [Bulinus truncatus]|nr:Cytochrome c oxidase assembly protein cox18, mitochondrial [Bulinus truncatus]
MGTRWVEIFRDSQDGWRFFQGPKMGGRVSGPRMGGDFQGSRMVELSGSRMGGVSGGSQDGWRLSRSQDGGDYWGPRVGGDCPGSPGWVEIFRVPGWVGDCQGPRMGGEFSGPRMDWRLSGSQDGWGVRVPIGWVEIVRVPGWVEIVSGSQDGWNYSKFKMGGNFSGSQELGGNFQGPRMVEIFRSQDGWNFRGPRMGGDFPEGSQDGWRFSRVPGWWRFSGSRDGWRFSGSQDGGRFLVPGWCCRRYWVPGWVEIVRVQDGWRLSGGLRMGGRFSGSRDGWEIFRVPGWGGDVSGSQDEVEIVRVPGWVEIFRVTGWVGPSGSQDGWGCQGSQDGWSCQGPRMGGVLGSQDGWRFSGSQDGLEIFRVQDGGDCQGARMGWRLSGVPGWVEIKWGPRMGGDCQGPRLGGDFQGPRMGGDCHVARWVSLSRIRMGGDFQGPRMVEIVRVPGWVEIVRVPGWVQEIVTVPKWDVSLRTSLPTYCNSLKAVSSISQQSTCMKQSNVNRLLLQDVSTTRCYLHRNFSTSSLKYVSIDSGTLSSQTLVTAFNTPTSQPVFSDFPTIKGAEKLIQCLHDFTGLQWWLTIIVSAFLMRVVLMIPLTIQTQQNQTKLLRLAPEVKEKSAALRAEVARAMVQFGWDKARAKKEYEKNIARILREMYIRDNCHPMKNVAIFWVQIPVFISLSYALRNMVMRAGNENLENHAAFSNMTNEGLAWFPDLLATDVTWILPILVGAVTLFNIEMAYLNLPAVTSYRRWLTMALRSISLIVIPISASVPSAVALYWVSSGVFAASQNLLFDYSSFRRLCGLNVSPTESVNPLRNLKDKAKLRYFTKEK